MTSRYDNRSAAINNAPMYRALLKKRGVNFIRQYKTPSMSFPTPIETGNIKEIDYLQFHK